jgi:hypothetical protein
LETGASVIQRNLVYHKTAKGSEAIATRQHGLGPKLRSMLILVDGKRGFNELAKLGQVLGDTEQLLSQLIGQGLIEPAPAAAAGSPSAPSGNAAGASGARKITLVEAQRFASRKLFDLLGPSSEPACLRIESARNAEDFQAAITLAGVMVNDVRSSKVAADFAAAVESHMPSA